MVKKERLTNSCERGAYRGFTLIELIYAIVIIGITFITLPMILINNSRILEQNLVQEAVLVTATKMGQILTFPWDENSRIDGNVLAKTEVVTVSTGDLDLNRSVSAPDFRVGHFQEALHRRMVPASAAATRTASTIGLDEASINVADDLDDFHNDTDSSSITSGTVAGYKNAYTMNTTVRYVTDSAVYTNTAIAFNFATAPAAQPSNLKMIEMSTDKTGATGGTESNIIVLRAYSANIGETDYYKRTY